MTVTTEIAVVLMTEPEARGCVEQIKTRLGDIAQGLENTRTLMLDLYERDGWRALGYESWRDCAVAELEMSMASVYRQLTAAHYDRVLSHGEKSVMLPVRVAAELAGLDDEAARETWDEVTAAKAGGQAVTARDVRTAVARKRNPQADRDEMPSEIDAEVRRATRPEMAQADEPNQADVDRASGMVGTNTSEWKPKVPPIDGGSPASHRSGAWVDVEVDAFVNFADSYFVADEIREVIGRLTTVMLDKRQRLEQTAQAKAASA